MRVEERIAQDLIKIRETKPLIHHITNYVVMNDTANVTLHIGALPVMAHAHEEVEEMTSAAGALVLNIGTLTDYWIESMILAGRKANELGIPVVLDPVGAGATNLRTSSAMRILDEVRVTVIRGNQGEIGALSGISGYVKGVESMDVLKEPLQIAEVLSRRIKATVAITGKRDIITNSSKSLGVDNGDPFLRTITGTGCMATTMIAAFCAVEEDPVIAAAGGLACFGIAAEMAAEVARGPATFKTALFDSIYNLTPEDVERRARIVEL